MRHLHLFVVAGLFAAIWVVLAEPHGQPTVPEERLAHTLGDIRNHVTKLYDMLDYKGPSTEYTWEAMEAAYERYQACLDKKGGRFSSCAEQVLMTPRLAPSETTETGERACATLQVNAYLEKDEEKLAELEHWTLCVHRPTSSLLHTVKKHHRAPTGSKTPHEARTPTNAAAVDKAYEATLI